VDWNYERASWPRRTIVKTLAGMDRVLLSIPGVQQLAGNAIIHGHAPRAALARATGAGQ